MAWREDKPLPFSDENEYRKFMKTLLQLAIDDGNNPVLAEQFFELQRRAWLYNHLEREIDYSKEEGLFKLGINNAVYGEPPKEEGAEIDF